MFKTYHFLSCFVFYVVLICAEDPGATALEIHRTLSGKSSILGSSYNPTERAIMQQRYGSSPELSSTTPSSGSRSPELSDSESAFKKIKSQSIIEGRERPRRAKGRISYRGGIIRVDANDGSDFHYHESIPSFVDRIISGTQYGDTLELRDDEGKKWEFKRIAADPSRGIATDYIKGMRK